MRNKPINVRDKLRICAINPRWFDDKFQQGSTTLFDIERAVDFVEHIDSKDNLIFDFIVFASPFSLENIKLPIFRHEVNLHLIKPPQLKPKGLFYKLLKKLLIQTDTFFFYFYHLTPNFLFRVRKYIDKAKIIYFAGTFSPFLFIYAKLKNKIIISDPYGIRIEAVRRALKQTKGKIWRFFNIVYYVNCYIIEFILSRLSDKIFMVSEKDRQILIRRFGLREDKVAYLPIPIRIDKYRIISQEERKLILDELKIDSNKKIIIFTGHLDSEQNLHVLEYIRKQLIPRILKTLIPVHFLVVGGWIKDNPLFRSDILITFTGYTPNPEKYIGVADVCLSPHVIGGGVKQKVLSYMACGKAVLATPEGCFGIEAENGRDIMIAPIGEYPEKLIQLLKDDQLRKRLGKNARQLILDKYDYKKVNKRRNEILREWGIIN